MSYGLHHSAASCRRKAGAPEPKKFLGHGIVDNVSRSTTLSLFVSAAADIAAAVKDLFTMLAVPYDQVRGVGIVVSKLDTSAASASAVPRAPAPGKAAAGRASTFDLANPGKYAGWMDVLLANSEAASDPTVLEPSATARASPMPNAGTVEAHFAATVSAEGVPSAPPASSPDTRRQAPQQAIRRTVPDADVAGASLDAGTLGPANLQAQASPSHNSAAAPDAPDSVTGAAARTAAHVALGEAAEPPAADPEPQERGADTVGAAPVAVAPAQHEPRASDEPVTAMPALDQLDMTVVDTLPPAMRLELMQAYGLHSTGPTPRKRAARTVVGKASGGSGRKRKAAGAASVAAKRPAPAIVRPAAPACKERRDGAGDIAVEACDAGPGPSVDIGAATAPAFGESGRGGRPRVAVHGLTLSQIDPETFQELPEDERRGLAAALPRSRSTFVAKQEIFDAQTSARQQTLVHDLQARLDALRCGVAMLPAVTSHFQHNS